MEINLKGSRMYQAVLVSRIYPESFLKLVELAAKWLGTAGLLVGLVVWALDRSVLFSAERWFSIPLILYPLGLSLLFWRIYVYWYLRQPQPVETGNLVDQFHFRLALSLDAAFRSAARQGAPELEPRHILEGLLGIGIDREVFFRLPELQLIANRVEGFKPGLFVGSLAEISLSASTQVVFDEAEKLRQSHSAGALSTLDVLAALFDYDQDLKVQLLNAGVDRADLDHFAYWYEHIWQFREDKKRFWSWEQLSRQEPVGKDWVYGFLPYLNLYARELTARSRNSALRLLSRQKEVDRLEEILVRPGENNILLVGLPGVGEGELIEDIAQLIRDGNALSGLNYKKVYDLNLMAVSGAGHSPAELQNLLVTVLNEAVRAGNIILVMRDIQNFLGGQSESVGRVDLGGILLPYFRAGSLQVIATTTPQAYHKFSEVQPDVVSLFEKVDVSEPSADETIRIVQEGLLRLEARTGVIVSYAAIKTAVSSAERFITDKPFPEKAFDLLAGTVSHLAAQRDHFVMTAADVQSVVSRKTGIPLGKAEGKELDTLTQFEQIMHEQLVGQDQAVKAVASTLRRLRTGLVRRGKPAGVFLFVGPTGVGKTLTAKILARTYFGGDDKMIRFDMSEFQTSDSIRRFIGSPEMNEPGQFISAARDNPFSLILLDEIEKANRNILNLFLQVFDEGHLTDAFGQRTSFEEHIIIATSNAGADKIREMVNAGQNPATMRDAMTDILLASGSFTPELLNRFDDVIVFHPLSSDDAYQVAVMLLNGLAKRLAADGYLFTPSEELARYVGTAGFDPQFGARPMQRLIQDRVESYIANKILKNEIERGKEFNVEVSEVSATQ